MGEPNWYVARNGQRVGPHTQAQLKDMAAGGQLRPADMVWQEGAAAWTAADKVPGLFGSAAEEPVPLDPPQPIAVNTPSPSGRTAQSPADAPPQLVSCPVCSGVVADNAYMCPHCGVPRPPLEQRWMWASWVLHWTYLPAVLLLPALPAMLAASGSNQQAWWAVFWFIYTGMVAWSGLRLRKRVPLVWKDFKKNRGWL
jgi:hypothetical protein